jgi:hypothetical protein
MWPYLYDHREALVLRIVDAGDNQEFRTDITVEDARKFIAEHIAEQVAAHAIDAWRSTYFTPRQRRRRMPLSKAT